MNRVVSDFNSLTASQKLAIHTKRIHATQYSIPPSSPQSFFRSLLKLSKPRDMATTFLLDEDERNISVQGEQKPIHFQGVTAPVVFVANNNNKYTGLYQSGGLGLIRLSRALPTDTPFVPGFALKVLIDGKPSVNFHAMFSLDGQNTSHFFENTFSTQVDSPKKLSVKALSFLFRLSLDHISKSPNLRPVTETHIPLIESASVTSDGVECANYIAPDKLVFQPQVSYQPSGGDFRDDIISNILSPCTLYTVFDQDKNMLGHINLIADFSKSTHGDEMMFKHQRTVQ